MSVKTRLGAMADHDLPLLRLKLLWVVDSLCNLNKFLYDIQWK